MSVKKLSRYDLVAVVGQGKLGPVWEGYDPDIRRKVTIKVAPVDQLSDAAAEAMAARFRAEARVAGKLTHPNIVGVYDAGVESGLAYIVTETVTGTTLDLMLRQPAGVPAEAMGRTMLQLLSALDYAHSRGVFHLGLQPSLLTVTANGSVKVSDFGAVAAAEPDDSTRAQGSLSEHIRFLAPEQVLGLEADARADLWAVGVMLYRLWTGQWPFSADSDFGLIQQIIKQPVALPSSLNAERGDEHDQLIARALAKAAGDRYPNAREFAADLSRIMARTAAAAPAAPGLLRRPGDTAPLDKPVTVSPPTAPAVAAPTPAPAAEDELSWWRRIQLSERPADFEAFLASHPRGVCADLARSRLRRLAGGSETPAPVAPERPDSDDETRMSPLFMPKSLAPASAPAHAPVSPPAPASVTPSTTAASAASAPTPAVLAAAQSAPEASARPAPAAPAAKGKAAPATATPPAGGRPWLPAAAGVVLIGAVAAWWLLRGGGAPSPAVPAVAASAPAAPASAAVAEVPAAAAVPSASATAASAAAAMAEAPPASAPAVPAVTPAAAAAVAATAGTVAVAGALAASGPKVGAAAASAPKPLTPREQAAARKAAADAAAKAKATAAMASAPVAAPRPAEEERPRPAPVAEAPKPVEAPASALPAPAQPCSGRVFLARLSCMKDTCQQAQWASHPQCVEFKRLDEANRGRRGGDQ